LQQPQKTGDKLERLQNSNNDDDDDVFRDPAVRSWIAAQQNKATELSSTRQHYMAQLLNATTTDDDWISWKPPEIQKPS